MQCAEREFVDLLIATHVAEAYGPQHVLKEYLHKQGWHFGYAACPFDYSKIPKAEVAVYQGGELRRHESGHRNNTRGIVSWIRDAWFVWICGRRLLSKKSAFIGINNLNAAVGILLRWLGRGNYVVYYVIDYTPQRFPSRLLNWLYQRVARFAARHADVIWNISERIRQVHLSWGTEPAKNILVPIGIHAAEIQIAPLAEIAPQQLVIVSALFENKGVQLCLEALPYLPEVRLTVIGTGPYGEALRQRAQALGVAERVEFLGMVDRRTLFTRLSRSRVALAPYQTDPANYSYYADSAKPKEYLACGIPVVITRVPWIAKEIEERPMGLAIDYDARQLADAAQKLMTDNRFWEKCREEALKFSQDTDWVKIFQHTLSARLQGWPEK